MSLPNIVFPLLGSSKIPASNPKRFLEAGLRSILIPFSSVIVLLKKLSIPAAPSRSLGLRLTSLGAVLLVLILSPSPTKAASPSIAANATLALTGRGAGTVVKPVILIGG